MKQFGMFQNIPDHPEDMSHLHKITFQGKVSVNWRTRRFHSRMGALHVYVGDLFKSIARRSEAVLPEEERLDKEKVARKVDGRRAKCGGHRRGRGRIQCVRRRGVDDAFVDVVMPTALAKMVLILGVMYSIMHIQMKIQLLKM
ncbi:uncharacterized protein LOC141698128 isoform X2 [Apium graveolens]|uniref:uncharacterized protein LOC141698128 isoform X2 n=1 Tax=Apium graveolens TaxID=4045 RepID=UPI003D7B3F24